MTDVHDNASAHASDNLVETLPKIDCPSTEDCTEILQMRS